MSQKVKASPKPSPKNTLFNYFARNSLNKSQNVVEKEKVAEKPEISAKKLDFSKYILINVQTAYLNILYS